MTLMTMLTFPVSVCPEHFVNRDTRIFFQAIDVLRKQEMEKILLRQQCQESVGDGRFEIPRMTCPSDCVERFGSMCEVADGEYGFWIGKCSGASLS